MAEGPRREASSDATAAAPGMPPLAWVQAVHVRLPYRRPLLDPTGEYTHRRVWLLRLRDADGSEGVGEAALHPATDEVATESLAALMRGTVDALAAAAEDAAAVPALAARLASEGAPGRAALAGLDGALAGLRLAAQSRGRAVPRDPHAAISIPVVASIGFGGPDAGADAAAQAVELGFETLELRAGYERQTSHLVDRLRAIRAAVGPEPRLRIDAGGAWDLETAAERLAAAEPFRIEFAEQPLPADDLTGHAALRERVGVPIGLDESIDSEGAARAALAEGAADVLVVKPARVGGGAATLRIAEAASARGVDVVLGTFYETGVGIAAALRIAAALGAGVPGANAPRPGAPRRGAPSAATPLPRTAHALATAGVLRHDLLAAPLVLGDGRMPVPDAVELDESELERYAMERVTGDPLRRSGGAHEPPVGRR